MRRYLPLIALLVLATTGSAMAVTQAQIEKRARTATRLLKRVTKSLANNKMMGRDNNTPESERAQRYLIARLKHRGHGLNAMAVGDEAYKQHFVQSGQIGTNLFAVIPGSELPNEYIIVGAHYDHLDTRSNASGDCSTGTAPGGEVCNGATDNSTGVAAVLAIGNAIRRLHPAPKRSVVLALWDAEEDGLLGSLYYVNHPLVPLAQTKGYVNYDIAGANLLPTLHTNTFAVGSETGGSVLRGIVDAAVAAQTLNVRPFSFIFGQLRSDYANFVNVGVPTVFYSDSTGGCYHTTGDDYGVVNFDKLAQQSQLGYRTAVALADAPIAPTFVPPNPALATYEDALSVQSVLSNAFPADLGLFSPADQALVTNFKVQIDQVVTDGPGAFDSGDVNTVLGAAVTLVNTLTNTGCHAF
ncbi:MAG: M28 family peptidase [bacterium]